MVERPTPGPEPIRDDGGVRGDGCDGPPWRLEHVLDQRSWVLTILMARTGGRWDVAEDVWAGLVAELVQRPSSLDEVVHLQPWLYRVGCRRAADWARSQRQIERIQSPTDSGREWAESVPARELPPLETLLAGERQAELRQVMTQLAPEDQEVLYLKYGHHWDYGQIGQHLDLTKMQVTHRLRVARQRLKLALLRSPLADDYQVAFHWEKVVENHEHGSRR